MIKLVCVGRVKEPHYQDACNEYLKRLGKYTRVDVVELNEQTDKNPEVAKKKEAELILEKIEPLLDYFEVVLDSTGDQFSSEEFSELLKKDKLVFIIGGPDGVGSSVKNQSDLVLSLSEMTLPHQLARVFLLEQVYRGFTILNKESYHK